MRQRGSVGFAAEPVGAPPTTRLGGGPSARLMTLVALLVLGAVAWVGFSNRPIGRDPTAGPSFAIVQASPAPSATASTTPSPTPDMLGPRHELRGDDGVIGSLPFLRRAPPTTVRPVAEPAVPLILLTATPWHTQRANRTHGESWVAGY
jgi:hypothetical protein